MVDARSSNRTGIRGRNLLLAAVVFGLAYRIVLAIRMPVGYDEIFDLSLGLLRMRVSGLQFLVEVPVERSTALAPLWWWIQALPFWAAGDISLFALRIMPMLFGAMILLVGFQSCRHHFDRSTAIDFLAMLALSDVLAFTCTRGEFAEPLIVLLALPCICRVGANDRGVIRGALWAAILLTNVGKGIFLIGLNIVVECAFMLLRRESMRIRALISSAAIAVVAFGTWFWVVHEHYAGTPIEHAVGRFDSFTDLLWAVTFDYPKYKAHVTGSMRDALQIFMDARVWPLTVLSFPVLAWSCLAVSFHGVRGLAQRRTFTFAESRSIALAIWVVVGFAIIVCRGTAGARFHLLYLPAAWLIVSGFLASGALATNRRLILGILITAIWFGFAISWTSWEGAVLAPMRIVIAAAIGVGICGAIGFVKRSYWDRVTAGAGLIVIVAMAVGAGPLAWAPAAVKGSEPMYNSRSLKLVDEAKYFWRVSPAEPTNSLPVFLSHYFLSQQQLDQAEHYARRAVDESPDDPVAWFYLGLVYDAVGRPPDARRRVWTKALELNPGSERVRERLLRLDDEQP